MMHGQLSNDNGKGGGERQAVAEAARTDNKTQPVTPQMSFDKFRPSVCIRWARRVR